MSTIWNQELHVAFQSNKPPKTPETKSNCHNVRYVAYSFRVVNVTLLHSIHSTRVRSVVFPPVVIEMAWPRYRRNGNGVDCRI